MVSLTWGLVVATYKRHEMLRRCLDAAFRQTRLPTEVLVVDASPDFDEVVAAFVDAYGDRAGVRFVFQRAHRASSTHQRNQGIALATADVLFLIDDDSLMYRDCAERIMAVYEADLEARVHGVCAIGVGQPPPEDGSEPLAEDPLLPEPSRDGPMLRVLRPFRRWLTAGSYFVPYDKEYPRCPIPASIPPQDIGRIDAAPGYAMTFRRDAIAAVGFEPLLSRYAAGEDQDASYRVSRHGALLNAVRARLHHATAPGGRLSEFTVAVLANLNQVVLHRKHSTDPKLSKKRLAANLRQRLLLNLVRDLRNRRFRLPKTRGTLFALRWFRRIWTMPMQELERFYPSFQDDLIAADKT